MSEDWKLELRYFKKFAKDNNLSFEKRNPNCPEYQLARLYNNEVCIIAYPHKSTAGNTFIKLRDQSSKNKSLYNELVNKIGRM